MKMRWICTVIAIGFAGASGAAATGLELSPYEFKATNGTVVAAEQGSFTVPERRDNPASRQIKITFVRFAATGASKGPPIVYLAGGPGGSGIGAARGARFPIFMAMREFGDVIALDQRGTGAANDIPRCERKREYPLDRPLTREAATSFFREVAAECVSFWQKAGIDLAGYNTDESAADVDELRRLLGAEKVTLWGISYGTHLALATFKRYPQRIEKAVLSSLEGLDETVKLPAGTDAFFARLQRVIDADPAVAKIYPDVAGTMRRVLARLDAQPVTVTVKDVAGKEVKLTLGKFDVQLMTAASISDPRVSANMPGLYAMMDSGDFSEVGKIVYNFLRKPGAMNFGAMELAMDVASGVSAPRARLVANQARSALLGDALNFPMPHLAGTSGIPDLGERFRSPVNTAVPTLFLSGTLDGRTYPESAVQIAKGFSNASLLTVENGGHNLFEAAPEIQEAIVAYMRTGKLQVTTIRLPPPVFPH
jgi:pimeloyl-ACP methyl ester carboxylesterase